ncbi:MAG TPA: hypothetical protein VFT30_00490 [Nitrospira sp.]|nr:hypothetical protein [Nitrospira sp.]
MTAWSPQSKSRMIPGISGKRIPGSNPGLPRMTGFHFTKVPRLSTSAEFRERHRQQVRDVRGTFRGGWGFAWQGLAAIAANIEQYAEETDEGLGRACERMAEDMVAYAKTNAIWKDHPGEHEDARQSIQAVVIKEPDGTWSIYLGHGKNVYYGIWLEVRWGGRYAIILPTVYKFAPQLGEEVKSQT